MLARSHPRAAGGHCRLVLFLAFRSRDTGIPSLGHLEITDYIFSSELYSIEVESESKQNPKRICHGEVDNSNDSTFLVNVDDDRL